MYNQFQKVYLILKFTENRDIWISNSGIFAKTKKKKLESKAELVVTQLSNKYYEWRSCVNWTNSFRYIWICSSAEREVISCNILLKMKKIIEKYRRKKSIEMSGANRIYYNKYEFGGGCILRRYDSGTHTKSEKGMKNNWI